MHVAPTATQVRAMSAYRPFETVGVIYTTTERNSVVIVEELRRLGRESRFSTVERTFRLDANPSFPGGGRPSGRAATRKPVVAGPADLVRELKEGGAQWLYLPPDSFL